MTGCATPHQPPHQVAQETTTNSAAAPDIAASAPLRPNSAIIPQLRSGYLRSHTNNVEIAKKGDIDVLFMGDSITDFWRNRGRAVFDKYFGSMKVANFGIAGDTTQGVLWRLQNGEATGYKPKAIMLMIGTNNTGGNSAPEIAMGVADIIFELRKDFPDAKILLLAIFPRNSPAPSKAKISEINRIIAALHDNRNVFFMDIGPLFLDANGTVPADIMNDGLHPTAKGYSIWAEAVHDRLTNLMQ
jgi:lysophospholipase L1-like esterase